MTVGHYALPVLLHEQVEHLSWFSMSTSLGLGVDQLAIDRDVEDTFGAGHECQGPNDVLVPGQDVIRCAHGALEIVSRDAVCDFYDMH